MFIAKSINNFRQIDINEFSQQPETESPIDFVCLGVSQFWISNRIQIESNCLNWKHFGVKHARGLWVQSTIVSINYIGFHFNFVWFSISINLRISLQFIHSTIALLSAALALMLHSLLYLFSLGKLHSIPFQLLSHYYRIVVVEPSVGSAPPQLFLIKHVEYYIRIIFNSIYCIFFNCNIASFNCCLLFWLSIFNLRWFPANS